MAGAKTVSVELTAEVQVGDAERSPRQHTDRMPELEGIRLEGRVTSLNNLSLVARNSNVDFVERRSQVLDAGMPPVVTNGAQALKDAYRGIEWLTISHWSFLLGSPASLFRS